MTTNRIVEYVFFFGLLAGVAYLVWSIISPFAGAIALAAIIVTICHPLYNWVLERTPRRNRSVASLFTVFLVLMIVVVPLFVLASFLLREAVSIYSMLGSGSQFNLQDSLSNLERSIQVFIPGFTIDITSFAQQAANFIATNITGLFTGTATTIFLFFIALIAAFYFFRDGATFTKFLVQLSPLDDEEDAQILNRLARAVRAVALGTVLIAIIQGTLTGIGLALFGFERAILWGSIASIGALIPGIGTSIVFIPSIIFLVLTGSYISAAFLALWAALAVGLIDNLLGPYLMSRGNAMHPFLILVSVLGGIIMFGPIGFILGPVALSLLLVLLELYGSHIAFPPKQMDEPQLIKDDI